MPKGHICLYRFTTEGPEGRTYLLPFKQTKAVSFKVFALYSIGNVYQLYTVPDTSTTMFQLREAMDELDPTKSTIYIVQADISHSLDLSCF